MRTPRRRGSLDRTSPRRRREEAIYWPRRRRFLEAHPRCEFRRRGGQPAHRQDYGARQCRRRATQVHHTRGRGRWYLDEAFWFASCVEDHDWITEHGKEARRLGYVERVFS